MGAFGVVESQRPGERIQDALRDAIHIAALKAGVVRDAHTCENPDLLAAQSGNAARAVAGYAGLVRGDACAAGGQELADLGLGVHNRRVDPPAHVWETLPVPPSTGTLTSRDPVLSWTRPMSLRTTGALS